jgi:hypothetical protein
MNGTDPRSWPDKLMGFSLSFLMAAIAVYVGIGLIVSVWQILLVIIATISAVMFTIAVIRYRSRGW